MSGRDFSDKDMLAAVKPLKTANFGQNQMVANGSKLAGAVTEATDLEGLFQEHHDRVFRAAYRVTGSAADAEDVLQTVFLRMARSSQSATTPENPASYFTRAAVNASLDLLRARKRSRAVGIDDTENRAVPIELVTSRNPESNHQDRELRDLIREAVSRLGSTAGQMFALRYFEGYDNGEIGKIMDTSALVVGVTLHRARMRLRKEIGSYLQQHQ